MENYVFDSNTKLVAVYYNVGELPFLFRISTDVTLSRLKGQLNQINVKLDGRSSWTLRWSNLLNIFNKVWSGPKTTKISGH